MLYKEYLETQSGDCPFCDYKERIIKENALAFLTYALAPYHSYHMLVIPKRHGETFLDLTNDEYQQVDELIRYGARLLQKLGNDEYSILVRSGSVAGRSVSHLHYHIIPKVHIGRVVDESDTREVLSKEEIDEFLNLCEKVSEEL